MVRSDKTQEVVIKNGIPGIQYASNFPNMLQNDRKTQTFEIILKVYPTKRENAFENKSTSFRKYGCKSELYASKLRYF